MSNVDVEELVGAYLEIRNERNRILAEYEAKDKELKSDIAEIEALMLTICNDVNADSIKTSHGTVMRKLNERFYCSDWLNFKSFVIEHNAVDLLERRIHQGNFKEFMKDHDGDGLPPGINVMREFGITVRKSSKESHE